MRKTKVVIGKSERDKGRAYLITEMPATKAEKWAIRALLGMGKRPDALMKGVDMGHLMSLGMEGFSMAFQVLGMRAIIGLDFEDAEPLLDEMMECVQFLPDAANTDNAVALHETHIEDVETRLLIRDEVVALHVGFSIAEKIWSWRTSLMTIASMRTTQTSPDPSEPLSPDA